MEAHIQDAMVQVRYLQPCTNFKRDSVKCKKKEWYIEVFGLLVRHLSFVILQNWIWH